MESQAATLPIIRDDDREVARVAVRIQRIACDAHDAIGAVGVHESDQGRVALVIDSRQAIDHFGAECLHALREAQIPRLERK
jgi:hypothetical protein